MNELTLRLSYNRLAEAWETPDGKQRFCNKVFCQFNLNESLSYLMSFSRIAKENFWEVLLVKPRGPWWQWYMPSFDDTKFDSNVHYFAGYETDEILDKLFFHESHEVRLWFTFTELK